MEIENVIKQKLSKEFVPLHLDVINESHQHNVPAGSESHFKVVIVSDAFEGKLLLARHRLVNAVLSTELNGQIHALALHTMTQVEWQSKQGKVSKSPPCLGGSNAKSS